MAGKSWNTIAKEKQAEREKLVKAELGKTEDGAAFEYDKYLRATASEIVKHIQDQTPGWTAENVMKAYIHRAAEAHEVVNCLTEVMFAEALDEARKLDAEFAETKQLRGPLHGVPVSLKDQIQVKDYDACIGFTEWAQKPCQVDSELVKQIRSAGGIPFVKTNVPDYVIFRLHTCGGSSGGEGALLACDGTALGIGSDVGGSLRIPTSFCGVYAIKPGHHRFPKFEVRGVTPGFEALRSVMGPMGRSVGDIEIACRTLFGKSDRPVEALPPVPYRDIEIPKKLKFGYYKTGGLSKACPAVQRAVQETVDALVKAGHECVEFVVPNELEGARVFVAVTSADRYETLTSHIGPDPKDPTLFLVTLGSRIPTFVRNGIIWAARTFLHDNIFSTLMGSSRGKSVKEFWAETKARDNYNELFFKEVWEKYGFDGIICPVSALPTIPHGSSADLSPLALATALYNVVDLPVGVVPVTRVDQAKDTMTDDWRNAEPQGSPFLFKKMYAGKKPAYDPVAMHGVPIGVQIVGNRWEEEKVIEMMKVVDGALGPRDFGPGTWSPSRFAHPKD